MLKISKKSFEVFQTEAETIANRKIVSHLRHRFPTDFQQRPNDEISRFVQQVRNEAKKYGVANEDDVVTVAELTVMYGDDFWNEDWAADVMQMEFLPADERIEFLRRRVRAVEPNF